MRADEEGLRAEEERPRAEEWRVDEGWRAEEGWTVEEEWRAVEGWRDRAGRLSEAQISWCVAILSGAKPRAHTAQRTRPSA